MNILFSCLIPLIIISNAMIYGYFQSNSSILVSLSNSIQLKNEINELIEYVSKVFCNLNGNFTFYYYEYGIPNELTEKILKNFYECRKTYIIIRKISENNVQNVINNDGILINLLMVVKDVKNPINLNYIKKKSGDKHRLFILVAIEDSTDLDLDWLRNVFNNFWKLWILNIVIVYWQNDEIQIYTYTPFTQEVLRKISKSYEKHELYPSTYVNMYRHRLRISLIEDEVRAVYNRQRKEFEGADGWMTKLIVNLMNATEELISTDEDYPGELFEDGTANGVLKQVAEEKVDIVLNTRLLIPNRFSAYIEGSIVYGRDDLCVLVPRSGYASLLLNVFRPFEFTVWIAILAVLFGMYITLRWLDKSLKNLFLCIYCINLSTSAKLSSNNNLLRIILSFWLAYSILITSSYRGNLTSNLVTPISLPETNTLDQLSDSPYKLLTLKRYSPFITLYLNLTKKSHRKIKSKLIEVEEKNFMEKLNSNDLSYAYINTHHLIQYWKYLKNHAKYNRLIFHNMATCLVPFYVVYMLPYGSPFKGTLNRIVRRTQEHGFILSWERKIEAWRKISGNRVMLNDKRGRPMILQLNHLQSAFYILYIGLLISLCVFLKEKYVFSFKTCKKFLGKSMLKIFSYLFSKKKE